MNKGTIEKMEFIRVYKGLHGDRRNKSQEINFLCSDVLEKLTPCMVSLDDGIFLIRHRMREFICKNQNVREYFYNLILH
jgi:hypothetical protein